MSKKQKKPAEEGGEKNTRRTMTGSAGAPDKQRISRVPRAHPCGTQEKLYHLSDPAAPDL